MQRLTRMRALVLVALTSLLAVGCDTPTDGHYAGPPLATIQGQLVADGPISHLDQGSVRLALAWLPGLVNPGIAYPKFIHTQNVAYQGQFPIGFTYDITTVPPDEALGVASASIDGQLQYPDAPKVGAGALFAYVDGNGNGQLDTIPRGQTQSPDRILGLSVDTLHPADAFLEVYSKGGQQPPPCNGRMGCTETQPIPVGFGLYGEGMKPLDLNAERVMHLRDDPKLIFLICEEYFANPNNPMPCGVSRR